MIRYLKAHDHAGVRALVSAAFGRDDEADLVERLRADEDVLFELVAEEGGELEGHVLFSRLWADRYEMYAALAPLAVRPDRQGAGVGSRLARAALESAREFGVHGVLVLGEPAYYGRFGFVAARDVKAPYAGRPAFQMLELEPGAFAAPLNVAYPAAFEA